MTTNILNYADYVGQKEEKFYKTTMFSGEHLMIGLNCLEPGQVQKVHSHDDQDKFYYVLEGSGHFTVGETSQTAEAGCVVWAEAGVPHGVENKAVSRLVLLVGIAPSP